LGAAVLRPTDPPQQNPAGPNPAARQPEAPQSRRDRFNDPLPDGAVARLGTLALRHGSNVDHLSFSANGKTLVSTGGGVIRRWDVDTGHEIDSFDFRQLGTEICACCLASDGKSAVIARRDTNLTNPANKQANLATIEVHNTGSRILKGELPLPTREVMAVSPNGRFVVAARGEIQQVWDVQKRDIIFFTPYGSAVFSADSTTLVTFESSKVIRVWDTATGRQRRHFGDNLGHPSWLALSPDGRWLATHDSKLGESKPISASLGMTSVIPAGVVRLWDVEKGELAATLETGKCAKGFTFSHDSKKLLVVSTIDKESRAVLQHWDVLDKKCISRWPDDPLVSGVPAQSPDGSVLAIAGNSGCIRMWNTATKTEISRAQGPCEAIMGFEFSTDGRTLWSDGATEHLEWELATTQLLERTVTAREWRNVNYITSNHRFMAALDMDLNSVRVTDLRTGNVIRDFNDLPKWPALALSEEGQTVFFLKDRHLSCWDVRSGKQLRSIELDWEEPSFHPRITPDGTMILAYGNKVAGFETMTGKQLFRWDMAAQGIVRDRGQSSVGTRLSIDGQTIACAPTEGEEIVLCETATARVQQRIKQAGISWSSLAFSPDGSLLAGATETGPATILVWDTKMGAKLHEYRGHRGRVLRLAFSPAGTRLVSGSVDCTALVWEIPRAK
jgi:WD40 repeat protein